MSRWSNRSIRDFNTNNGDFWTGPRNHYIITTDQTTFHVDRIRLDYKKTIENLTRAGYTNISIVHAGKNVTWKAI